MRSVSPASGSTFGGTTVTISGENFEAGAMVTIAGAQVTDASVVDSSTIAVITGQHAAGAVDITVSSGGHSSTLHGAFTYVSPGAIVNTPPTIVSLTARGTRPNEPVQFADLNETIGLSATVQDAETSPDLLGYEWSSSAGGTFTGTGNSVQWRAPDAAATPLTVTIGLTVVEHYNDADPNGLPVPKEHRVTSSTAVSVHDSAKEVGAMARQFLLDFSDSSIRDVPYIMRNFTMTCVEAQQESQEVADNRIHHKITSYSVGTPAVTINFGGICQYRSRPGDACAEVQVDWKGTDLDTKLPEESKGIDQVTAKYRPTEGGWRLCGSDFLGGSTPLNVNHPFIR